MRPGLRRAVRWWAKVPRPRPAITVLGYHRVDDVDDELAVRPANFKRQAALLDANREQCPIVALEPGLRELSVGQPARRSVTVTFDDAWADNHTHALAAIVEHRLPTTLFVPSKLLGTPGYLAPAQLVEMAAAGVEIGGHTRTHVDLRACSDDELESEVRGGKEDLEDLLGHTVLTFAYPSGLYDGRVRRAVIDAGYAVAVSTHRGSARSGSDWFAVPRHFVEDDIDDATFAATVLGGMDVVGLLERARGLARR